MRAHPLMVAGEAMLDTEPTARAPPARGQARRRRGAVRRMGRRRRAGDGGQGGRRRQRARPCAALAAETLRQMGVLREEEVTRLAEIETLTVRTMTGVEVGRVRPAFLLQRG